MMGSMLASLLLLLTLNPAPADPLPPGSTTPHTTADSAGRAASAPADTLPSPARIVRRFPPIEVRAAAIDMFSSQTVQPIGVEAMRALPIDDLAGVLGLQAGVVAQGEELHVRGGRVGETTEILDGLTLNEPLRRRAMELPLLALRGIDLVSGGPDARYDAGLAGVLDLHTFDPGHAASGELRWQGDGRTGTHFDRLSGRIGGPLPRLGLGFVAAADALLDDTWLPALRTDSRRDLLGMRFGWRAENRLLGYLKLAPVERPRRVSAQLVVNRQVHRPYDPQWSLDGWSFLPDDAKASPVFSSVPLPGYRRYRAADHLAITDDRTLALNVSASTLGHDRRGTVSLGWLRARTITSLDGRPQRTDISRRPSYGNPFEADQFHVRWGDDALDRETASDSWSLRGDGEWTLKSGGFVRGGAGASYDRLESREIEWLPLGWWIAGEVPTAPLDTIRTYRAWAPGAFGYAQGRWISGGMVVNAGLRADWFTPGPQAGEQSLPGNPAGTLSLSPRLGVAYPVSVRDVFSLSYVRIAQAPNRDALYDNRLAISGRQPLGNAALVPSTVISYEAAVKHLLGAVWSMQTSVFVRDLFGQIGARNITAPGGETNLSYTNDDEGHAIGFEFSVVRAGAPDRRFEAHYTWMQAYGNESFAEGDPYGPIRDASAAPIADLPLSWDRRHSLNASGMLTWRERWTLAWSTAVASGLPWTPKPVRQFPDDPTTINSRRLGWTEVTNLDLRWSPRQLPRFTLGLHARNLFDHLNERAATVDGFPNPLINTLYDDYGAYRTQTGQGGGAYWSHAGFADPVWVPVHDPRLYDAPRAIRASVDLRW
jgi:outer membrane receptor protein involved in Fe transport